MQQNGRDNLAEALQQLLEQLRVAREEYREGEGSGRRGAISALNAVAEFLNRFEEVHEEHLTAPIVFVSIALLDLDDGISSPLLSAPRKLGRKPSSTNRKYTRAFAALTCDLLMKTGLSRYEAANLVAARLQQLGVVQHGGGGLEKAVNHTTIINWRNAAWETKTYNEMRERAEIRQGVSKSKVRKDQA